MPFTLPAGLRRITGRDPHEPGRVASTLELLYDLTFVVAVGVAAGHLAETVAAGHVGLGIAGFVFAMLAIFVTWINFSWLNSASASPSGCGGPTSWSPLATCCTAVPVAVTCSATATSRYWWRSPLRAPASIWSARIWNTSRRWARWPRCWPW